MKRVQIRKWCIALLVIPFMVGCQTNTPRPQITFGPETVQFGDVIIEAAVDPNETTVSEIRIEWGRRPGPEHAVSVPATNFFESNALKDSATSATIQLPTERPFFGKFDYGFPAAGTPLSEGEILDYQIRVTHSNPDGGTLFFWSPRQSFTYHVADVPSGGPVNPQPGAGGNSAMECSDETTWISIHTGTGTIANNGGATTPAVSADGKVIAFASPVAFDPDDTNTADDIYIHDREEEETIRVSIHTGGGSIDNTGRAKTPAVSGNGNSIAFVTPVGFDPDDTNDADDIYVHDREENRTTRVSVHLGNGSIDNNGGAKTPAISSDGKIIAFVTPVGFDTNDNNDADDVYIHDRNTNEIKRVSIYTGSGSITNSGGAKTPAVSADGNVIAFVTPVGFDSNDNNDADDVYTFNRSTNQTTRVSIHTGNGSIANDGGARMPSVSEDGNVIAFVTPVGFDSNDTNEADDIYIHDRAANQTTRVSIHTGNGSIANDGGAKAPSISRDGNVVAFVTPINFESDDNNNADDIYIRDRAVSETTRVSIHTGNGSITNDGGAKTPSASGDGGVIAFTTPVGFDPDDVNNADDIYIHCR